MFESASVGLWFDRTQLSSVFAKQISLNNTFSLLLEVPLLQVVDDCDVVDSVVLCKTVLLPKDVNECFLFYLPEQVFFFLAIIFYVAKESGTSLYEWVLAFDIDAASLRISTSV